MDKRRKTIIKFNKATLTDSNKMLSEMKKELQAKSYEYNR